MLKDITILIQVVTAILSCVLYKRYSSGYYKYLLSILILSAAVEVWGYYDGTVKLVWNIYTVAVFVLVYLLFREILIGKIVQTVCLTLLTILVCIGVINFFYKGLFYNLLIFGAVSTSVFSFFYLRQLLLSDEILNYKKLLPFWISVGFLVFYLPSIPFFTFWRYMDGRNLFFILKTLVILMNLIIIYGLICSKKEEKY